MPCLSLAQTPYQEAGRAGDAGSWRTAEFNTDWGLAAIGADHAYARGLTGEGFALGLLDTGVAMDHSEFRGRGHVALHLGQASCGQPDTLVFRSASPCFASDGDHPSVMVTKSQNPDEPVETDYEYELHGTHVAGTMAASRDGTGMHGVAFKSRLVSARYYGDKFKYEGFDEDGVPLSKNFSSPHANTASLISQAYDAMQANGVRAVNLELWRPVRASPASANTVAGLQRTYEGMRDFVDSLVDATIKHKMVTVVAAGNDDGRIANIYPSLPVFRPEAEAHWLAVVNVNAKSVLDPSSSVCAQAKNWCVAAPGTEIYSTTIQGGLAGKITGDIEGSAPIQVDLKRSEPTLGYGNETGTSMAAPHAIGALGLLFQRYPYLSAMQVRDVLLTTAKDIGEPGIDDKYGWGLIDLKRGMEGYGQLRVDTDVVMNSRAGGAKLWLGPAWDDWRNDIGGKGRLTKSGEGWLRLSGQNSFAGASVRDGVLEFSGDNRLQGRVEVDGGQLLLSGQLRGSDLLVRTGTATIDGRLQDGQVTVQSSGRLQGVGTLAALDLAGTLAPAGAAIGALHVSGDYVQRAGSVLQVDVKAPREADQLVVEGHATLEGGALQVAAQPGVFLLGQRYTVLTAAQGVSGRFATLEQDASLPFLKWQLGYAPQQVHLDVSRGQLLAAAAGTANQRAVAHAADAMPELAALPGWLTQLRWEQAGPALDSLSGELHASTQAALMQSVSGVREAVTQRARSAHDRWNAQDGSENSQGVWLELKHVGGQLTDSHGEAARTRHSANTQVLGYDHRLQNGMTLGVMAGVGRGDVHVAERASRSDASSRYLGVYGSQQWGRVGVRAGFLQADHDLRSQRETAIGTFIATSVGRHHARCQQGFVEAAYRWQAEKWDLEPYLQWAHLRQRSPGFEESGGIQALSVHASTQRVNLATAGLRFNLQIDPAQGRPWLGLRGGLAYRHVQGDASSTQRSHWQGGADFGIAGVDMATSGALLDLGIVARLSARASLDLGYSGQFQQRGRENSLNLRYWLQF